MKTFLWLSVLIATSAYASENVPSTIIESHTNLALKVYAELVKTHQNIVFSALSLDTILALTYLGSKGETANQLKSVLQLNISDDQIKSDIRAVTKQLNNPQSVVIETANKLYLADGIKIEPEYLKTAVDDFSAGVENVNFNQGKEASEAINSWVEKQTHQKIKDLTKPDQFSALTRLVLVNTLYFQGSWLHPFAESLTEKQDFHKSKTEVVQVDMMQLTGHLLVQRNPNLKVSLVQLPFVHGNAILTIVLPDEVDGTAEIDLLKIGEQLNFTTEYVQMLLPKFRLETTIDMIPVLKKLGITDLFQAPDLSGITKENLVVSSIIQKVFLDVNEHGAEAAAATFAEAVNYAYVEKPKPTVFKVDHPFMIGLEYDGLFLMTGRVIDI